MREIKAIIRPERLRAVLHALHAMPDLPGVTISTVQSLGRRHPPEDAEETFDAVDMTKLEIVVSAAIAQDVFRAIEQAAHTGRVGDGKIFMVEFAQAVRIRSGDRDVSAL